MKTSSISLRVADFLKEYPPFSYLSQEDLLDIAGAGRVKFHEEGEHVFDEGEPRGRHFFVVQQGKVNLYQRSAKGSEELVDVRVEGDLLGIYWLMSEHPYRYTAITDSDTLLYALPFEQFLPIASAYTEATRYLADYFSARPGSKETDTEAAGSDTQTGQWLKKRGIGQTYGHEAYLNCTPGTLVKEVAALLSRHQQQAVLVMDEKRHPLGIVTEADLCHHVATGKISPDAPVETLMSRPVLTISPYLSTGEVMLIMLRHRLRHLCVTEDGTTGTPAVGLISEREMQLYHGRMPNALGRQMTAATDTQALARLRDRADELMLEYLETDANINFLTGYIAEIDGLVLNRAIALAEQELMHQGLEKPDTPFCWLAMHSEGRQERLIRSAQRTALVYEDPPKEQARYCRRWFLHLAEEVSHMLAACGFPMDANGRMASNTTWCKPLSKWKQYYSRWIHDPIDSNIITLTPFFDLRGVAGELRLADELRAHILTEIKQNPTFIPLLANDAMANLPPVTIFRDSVMDKAGILWTCIDTKLHALYPLVDVARVFTLEHEQEDCTSTVARFERIAEIVPEEGVLFRSAAEAARSSLSLQSLIGHRRGDNGQFIRPHELTKVDQEQIKSVFRTIVKLLDHSASHFKLNT